MKNHLSLAYVVWFTALQASPFLLTGQAATSVVSWGQGASGQNNVPVGLTNVVALAEGSDFDLALRIDGSVLAWGNHWNGYRYVPVTVPPDLENVVAIAAGYDFSLVLKNDGTVFAWGENVLRQTEVPPGLTDVVAIAAGYGHSLALKSDGRVVAWGYDTSGNTAVPADLTNVVAIAAGLSHSLALKTDGTVVAWGGYCSTRDASFVPAELTDAVAISGGCAHSTALKSDGTVVAWGENFSGQTAVPAGLTNVVAIAAGETHNLALTGDGHLVGWGANHFGQARAPVGLANVVSIAAGWEHSVALVATPAVCDLAVTPTTTSFDYQGGSTNIYVLTYSVCPWAAANDNDWIVAQSGTSRPGSGYLHVLVTPNRLASSRRGVIGVDGQVITIEQAGVPSELLPQIFRQPTGRVFKKSGGAFKLRVQIKTHRKEIGPVTFQWYFNGTLIPGATDAELALTEIGPAGAGDYYVVVSNLFGDVVSTTATIAFIGNQ